ncbi:defensin-like protein 1 [Rhodamnia argentea]|uniref:Defensin-like protein 1 n=1 Tax=Rhodamnia argentea TaxID=178133 RepID=A0A8B8QTB5_9MYRT|nr:defensin-like protein 1 [Rhodamnia argentea]
MEKSKMRCCMGLFLMLLLVLAAQEAEGRVCESQSHGFRGTCFRSHNCALVCRNEGFSGGECHGLRGRCFCTKLC